MRLAEDGAVAAVFSELDSILASKEEERTVRKALGNVPSGMPEDQWIGLDISTFQCFEESVFITKTQNNFLSIFRIVLEGRNRGGH